MPSLSLTSAASAAPAHAGRRRAGRFNAERCVYNWKPSNTRKLKAQLGLGGYFGAARGALLIYGDSASEAQVGTATWNHQFSWPSVLHQCLTAGGDLVTAGAGGLIPGGSQVFFGSSSINGFDGRVARTGTWTNSTNGYVTGTNGSTMTYPLIYNGVPITKVSGTQVDVAYEYVAGSSFTVAIDGGAAVAVPMVSAGYKRYSVTGLADTTHSVVITVTSATAPRITGISVVRPYGFVTHNMARSGSTAEEWGSGVAGGLREHRINALPLNTVAGGAIVKLGANDLNLNGRSAEQVKGYLNNLKSGHLTQVDTILMTYSEPGVPLEQWLPLMKMYYDLADEWDCPLIDVNARTGGFAMANANGIMSGDANHPNTKYHAALGAAVADLIQS